MLKHLRQFLIMQIQTSDKSLSPTMFSSLSSESWWYSAGFLQLQISPQNGCQALQDPDDEEDRSLWNLHNRKLLTVSSVRLLPWCKPFLSRLSQTLTYLWGIGVVEHAEDDLGHGVLGVGHVSRWGEGGQVVLQGLTQHAVKGDVWTKDVALLPAVFL